MKETTVSSTSILVLRIAVSGIFIAAGINHLQKPQGIAKRILEAPSGEFLSSIVDPQFLGHTSPYQPTGKQIVVVFSFYKIYINN